MGNTFQTLILLNSVNSSGSTSKITDVAAVVRKGVRGQVAGSGDIFMYVCVKKNNRHVVDDLWLGVCVLHVSARQSRTKEVTSGSKQVLSSYFCQRRLVLPYLTCCVFGVRDEFFATNVKMPLLRYIL